MAHSSPPRVDLVREGRVAYLVIDHQDRRNALTFSMWDGLPGQLRSIDEDPACRLVVLRGAGRRAFSAGSDISEFDALRSTPAGIARYNAAAARAVASLRRLRKPVVARIQGACLGAGMALALHCDLRYADDTASFGIPAGKLGVGYQPLWLQRLNSLVGPAAAKEIMFMSARYDARAARDMGLVNRVCSGDEFIETVKTLCDMAPLTLAASKIAIDQANDPDHYDHDACEAAMRACFDSSDYIEGRAAFRQKRKPEFTGH